MKEELADVFIFAFLLAKKHKMNITDIILNKISLNEKKYPSEKATNTARKYDEL